TITSVLWGTTGTAATFAPEVSPLAIGAAALGIGGLLQAASAVPALPRHRRALRGRARRVGPGALAVALYPPAVYSRTPPAGAARRVRTRVLGPATGRGRAGLPGRDPLGGVAGLRGRRPLGAFLLGRHALEAGGLRAGRLEGAVFGLGGLLLMPVLAVTGGP